MKTDEQNALDQTPVDPGQIAQNRTSFAMPRLKVAHRCRVDRSKTPPEMHDHTLSVEGVPVPAELLKGAVSIRVNGVWFTSVLPGLEKTFESVWEECDPTKT